MSNIEPLYTDMAEYHPPVCKWDEKYLGVGWEDMCGNDEIDQKLNFFLFRRGIFDPESDCINFPDDQTLQ